MPDSQLGVAGPNETPRYSWQYDENHQRIKEIRSDATGTRTTWMLHPDNQGGLGFEREDGPSGASNRHYLMVGGQVIGVLVSNQALPTLGANQTAPTSTGVPLVKVEYWHKDHLGSLTATTDHVGAVTARYAYDPFGKRRQPSGQYDEFGTLVIDWSGSSARGTDRGYTGHEHLDDVGLIHMNGRIFDPRLGVMLQPDPYIQDPASLQNYNRYGYCLNNPLTCTDPSGLTSLNPFKLAKYLDPAAYFLASKIVKTRWGYTVGAIAIGVVWSLYCGPLVGLCNGAGQAAWAGFAGYSDSDALKIGLISGATAQAFYAVGSNVPSGLDANGSIVDYGQFATAVAAHAAVGCASSVASGQNCTSGALSAAFSKGVTPWTSQMVGFQAVVASAIVGGTAAELGGGKFSNGAVTGAFSYLFNELMHSGYGGTDSERIARAGYSDYQHSRLSNGELLVQSLTVDGDVAAQVLVRRGVDLPLSAIDALMDVSRAANGAMIDVISGVRDAAAQQALINAGNPRAAQASQHTFGIAADFYILGMSTSQAASLTYTTGPFPRVNLYLRSGGAVHVDFLRNRPGVTYFVDWTPKKCC